MSVVGLKNVISRTFTFDNNKNNNKQQSQGLLSDINNDYPANYGGVSNNVSDRSQHLVDEESLIGNDNSTVLSEMSFSQSSMFTKFFNTFDPRVMSDMIIGLSDGLTVPFALTAGLSSLGDTKLVITGGFAELVSGAISMGLGGYLAAKSESQYYHNEVSKEKQLFMKSKTDIEYELVDILEDIGITDENAVNLFIDDLEKKPKNLVDFVIRFGKGLEEPAENRQMTSALTIGLSYFLGGFIPLLPYFFVQTVQKGLLISCIVMAIALFLFGYFKTVVSMGADCGNWQKVSEGFQMLAVGGFASLCAWTLVKLIEN